MNEEEKIDSLLKDGYKIVSNEHFVPDNGNSIVTFVKDNDTVRVELTKIRLDLDLIFELNAKYL